MLFLRLDTWLVIAALLGAWAITWVLLCLYLSAAGGWMRLGRTFRLAGPFRGETWERESARMRFFTKYWLVMIVGGSAEGLYLSVPVWRLWHPPLLIPWREVTVRKVGGEVEFRLGLQERIRLRVRGDVGWFLKLEAKGQWPGYDGEGKV